MLQLYTAGLVLSQLKLLANIQAYYSAALTEGTYLLDLNWYYYLQQSNRGCVGLLWEPYAEIVPITEEALQLILIENREQLPGQCIWTINVIPEIIYHNGHWALYKEEILNLEYLYPGYTLHKSSNGIQLVLFRPILPPCR